MSNWRQLCDEPSSAELAQISRRLNRNKQTREIVMHTGWGRFLGIGLLCCGVAAGCSAASENKSAITTSGGLPAGGGAVAAAASTSAGRPEPSQDQAAVVPAPTGSGSTGGPPVAAEAFRAIIWNAAMTVESPDVPATLAAIKTAAIKRDSSVSAEESTLGDAPVGRLTLRTPPTELVGLQNDINQLGSVVERTQKGDDVTVQVVDLDARVKTQQQSVIRTRAFLDKAQNLSELAQMEAELTRREGDLESMLAQQRALSNQTSLATLTVTVRKTVAKQAVRLVAKSKGFVEGLPGIGHSLAAGGRAGWVVLRLILVGLAYAWPFILVAMPLMWFARRRLIGQRAS